MERCVTKEVIKKVILDINPLVRKYFKNVVQFQTGINPEEANKLDLKESIHFLEHIWGGCLDWGNQRIDYIEKSVRQLNEFLKSFTSEKEIHDPQIFLKKLKNYYGEKNDNSLRDEDPIRQITKLLTKFHSVRIKSAALIMRFLCLDSNFFDVHKSKLIPPLDRVNYRMCEQLLDKKLGKISASFNETAHKKFQDIGEEILGENMILIDNLWFIGHFYHDGRKHTHSLCGVRKGAMIVDFPFLKDIIEKMPRQCPFLKYGCKRAL